MSKNKKSDERSPEQIESVMARALRRSFKMAPKPHGAAAKRTPSDPAMRASAKKRAPSA